MKADYWALVRDTLRWMGHVEPLPSSEPPKRIEPPKPAKPTLLKKTTPLRPKARLVEPQKLTIEREAVVSLEPMEPPAEEPIRDVARRITERLPHFKLIREIPDDAQARALREQWKKRRSIPDLLVLTFEESIQSRTFLANLAKAISLCIAPCEMVAARQIERLQQWESYLDPNQVRGVITTDYGLNGYEPARRLYHAKEQRLGRIPLLLLTDLPRYFQDPHLKASLWAALCRRYGR